MGIIQDIDSALAFVDNVATVSELAKLGARILQKMRGAGVSAPVAAMQAVIDAELAAAEKAADVAEDAKVGPKA